MNAETRQEPERNTRPLGVRGAPYSERPEETPDACSEGILVKTSGITSERRRAERRDGRLAAVLEQVDPRGSTAATGYAVDRHEASARPLLIRDEWLSEVRRRGSERLDPHIYPSGVSGLTVTAAADRAYAKITDIMGRGGEGYPGTELRRLYMAITSCLLARVRRDDLYRLAAMMAVARRERGSFAQTTLLRAYEEALKRAFLADISVGEAVMSPAGPGEVRYITADGTHAVVEVFDGFSAAGATASAAAAGEESKAQVEGCGISEAAAGAEIFCALREVSRLFEAVDTATQR